MKFLICIILFLSVLPLDASKNLLKNHDFEKKSVARSKEISDWKIWGDNVYEIYEKVKHNGKFSVKFWWSGGVYQQFKADPGDEYQLKAYLSTPRNEPLDNNGTKFATVQLQFISSKNEIINVVESEQFNRDREIGKWYLLKVKASTPPNARFVRAAVEFVGGEGGGVICFDNIELKLTRKSKFSQKKYSKNLEGKWLFKKGDDLKWAKSNYNDRNWQKIDVPLRWEEKYPGYDGFGWYRVHLKVPKKLKSTPLFLLLGGVDDADEAYFNGVKIGSKGRMHANFQTAWDKKRQYKIPANIIKYGKDNVLAIRVQDSSGDGGIVRRPVRIFSPASLKSYIDELENTGSNLGKPITGKEFAEWKKKAKKFRPSRCTIKKLPNGGWTFLLPDKKPFMPVGIEYEPLAMYDEMDWDLVERDLNLIKNNGFNTITVWCMDFNASGGAGRRMSIKEMVKLTALAEKKELYIQFYLNIDRFLHLFPRAILPDGTEHCFDIDYTHPDYRNFVKNFAKRLAISLYSYNNVSTIVVWEEKIGLDMKIDKDKVSVHSLFGSKWGKAQFKNYLKKKHKTIKKLNKKWGTTYSSFNKAVDSSLLDFYKGVHDSDHRQYDILEFGQIMLLDFTKVFVNAYKSIDPTMLFQCRNWDLFGPVRTIDPRYSFLDSFGINNYSLGHNGYDIVLREETVKMKLVEGITGIAPYVSNFGFRTKTLDGGTHGLVPNEKVKARLASDSLAVFSFLPEMIGTSYFTFLYRGIEGPWGIVKDTKGEVLPIYHSFNSLHSLFSQKNKEIALSDYAEKPKIFIFHGLDAIYDLRPGCWIEHTTMSYDLTEMNLNYKVITDTDSFDPSKRPVIIANFHSYDEKLDTQVAKKLINYCKNGGTLIIGNEFGKYDRYVWPNNKIKKSLNHLRGIKISKLKKGKVKIIIPGKKYNIPNFEIKDTYYVKATYKTLSSNSEVILEMEVDGKKQPGLIRKRFGKGTVYYFLFNPYYQKYWHKPKNINRTSLPVFHLLFKEIGIKHDTKFGNRGFNLKKGRINLHEKPLHYFISKEADKFGTYKDEYGHDKENYSGGVITDDFISFRGKKIKEKGWEIKSSDVTSIYACINGDKLNYSTTDSVNLVIIKNGKKIKQKTKKYKIYKSILKK